MGRSPGIEIVRRAYELWEQAGKPEGRDLARNKTFSAEARRAPSIKRLPV